MSANNSGRAKVVAFVFCCAALFSPVTNAQVKTWLIPGDGFFETGTNWSPGGVPDADDTIRFVLQVEQAVSLFGDNIVSNLEANNGAHVTFGIAGPSSQRTLTVGGDATFSDDAKLSVVGNGVDSFVMDLQGNLVGASSLSLLNGGVLNADRAEFEANHPLPLVVQGANSALNVERLLIKFGTANELPELTISDGASVTSATLTRFDKVNITMSGEDARGNPSRWNTGHFTHDFGNLRIADGAVINSRDVEFGRFDNLSADAILSGVDSSGRPTTWSIAGQLHMAGSIPIIEVREGAELTTGDVITGARSARIQVGERQLPSGFTSRWMANGNVYLGGTEIGPDGAAFFEVGFDGEVYVADRLTLWPDAAFSMYFGSKVVARRIENSYGGTFSFRGGLLQTNMFVGDLENRRGTLAPGGDDAGHTTIVGDYTHLADSILAIDIGGSVASSEYDVLQTAGFVFLDGGDLELELIDGFMPTGEDELLIAATASIVGSFQNVMNGERLTTTDGGGSFVVNYGFGSAFDIRNVVLSDYEPIQSLPADFNADGLSDCADVDALVEEIVRGSNTPTFDLTGDGQVDHADLTAWLAQAGSTNLPSGDSYLVGDANLDGSVDVSDFNIWNGNKFTNRIGWCSGDFDADGSVDVSDFNLWNSNKFSAADNTTIVPEPPDSSTFLLGFMVLGCLRRRTWKATLSERMLLKATRCCPASVCLSPRKTDLTKSDD